MRERLTWDEIKARYPDEWVIVAEPEEDANEELTQGVLLSHDPEKERALAPFSRFDEFVAILFTGEPKGGIFGVDVDPVD